MTFLINETQGASFSKATVRGGGTEFRKSIGFMGRRKGLNHMTMTLVSDEHHRALLRRLSAASSIVFGLVLVASSHLLPLFDASPLLVPDANSPLLRWDIFHFLHIARHGYVYEHEWAFFPAAPWIVRYSLALLNWATKSVALSHFILAVAMSALASETVQTLYSLSLHHFNSPHMALLASLLALLPSSPATLLFVPYNEPFFTYLSYQGMHAPIPLLILTHYQECWPAHATNGHGPLSFLRSQLPSDQMVYS